MKNKRFKSKKLFICFIAAFFLAFFSFAIYSLVAGRLSFADSDAWDGETIANTFQKGNGTKENPYIIQDAPEFVYFKNLIEGDSSSAYRDKYYELGNDIDFGDHEITPIGIVVPKKNKVVVEETVEETTEEKSSEEEIIEENETVEEVVEEEINDERYFQGHFDGKGYTLSHLKITEPTVIDDTSYYSLFTKTKNATITSLGIDGFQILLGELEDQGPTIVSTLVGTSEISDENNSLFHDIYMEHFYLDISHSSNEKTIIGALIGEKDPKVKVWNIPITGEIHANESFSAIKISTNDELVSNIIDRVKVINASFDSLTYEDAHTIYYLKDDTLFLEDQEVSMENVLQGFNDSLGEGLYWSFEEDAFTIQEYAKVDIDVPTTSQSFAFSIQKAPNFSVHASGVDGNTVYINNLDSDYQYYMGLNYTTSSNRDTPTMADKGIYTNSNLVKFEVIYHGDLDANHIGTISYASGENQNTVVYYKYYYVTGSTFDLELIDNPFSGRPDGMAFNGWFSKDSDVTLYLDQEYYTWHAVVPVNGDTKVVELYASWVEARMARTSDNSNSIERSLGQLYNAGMHTANVSETRTRTLNIIGSDRYYYLAVTLTRGQSQSGYYSRGGYSLSGTCGNNTCTVYQRLTAGSAYDSTLTYYYSNGNNMIEVDPRATEQYQAIRTIYENMTMANFYTQEHINRNQSQEGYYGDDGTTLTGNCNTSGGCNVYEKILYQNSVADPDTTYYYLVTRDTNFVYLNTNSDTASNNYWSTAKPFTLTSWYYKATDSRGSAYYNMSITYMRAVAATRVEYVLLYSTSNGNIENSNLTTSNQGTTYVYGNRQNFKFGRGVTRNGTFRSAVAITGGSNDTTNRSNVKYKFIVESGYFGYISPVSLRASATLTNPYIIGIYGSDYDRVRNQHTGLDVYRTIYGSHNYSVNCSTAGTIGVEQTVLSGTIGSYQTDSVTTMGIYVSSNYSSHLTCGAQLTVEGGIINNIYGGPGPSSSQANNNAVFIYFKGGTADAIFGGGAYLVSYGNRIVQVTGGLVNYAVTGGSNGSAASTTNSDQRATLNGDTYTYIGGSAEIGKPSLLNQTPPASKFDMEVGSVFGVGNGKSSSNQIGSCDNAYVVVNGARIHGNVFGGANYGAADVSKNNGTYETKVKVVSGTIDQSVYSGGNNNGAGNANATVNTSVEVAGGTVTGSVYGGSKSKGTIYGNSTVTISGGSIGVDVYGGGEGGYTNGNNPGTYVRGNVNVTVDNGNISGNVYGGSAYGTVNAVNQNTNTSNYTTNVTINNGTISGNVFGGAKGSTSFTPKVVGNITVTVNGGSIGKVFGGFDESGQPSGTDVVYLNGGTIGDAFGGGNNANQNTTDIRLQGSDITGNLYGGSNLLGTVSTSHVTVSSGSVTDIYGGNNLGGMTVTTNVDVTGGTIHGDIYGGGNEASSTTSNIDINGATVHDVYGGGKNAGVGTTNIDIQNASGGSVFGGSNVDGNVTTSNVDIQTSQFTSAYGGNNSGGQTTTTNLTIATSTITDVYGGGDNAVSGVSHVTINSGDIGNVYGGGNEAGLTTSYVTVNDGEIDNVFGGSNTKGNVTTSNITVGNNQSANLHIGTLYGGNNLGGVTTTTNITTHKGTVDTIYGGGNEAAVGSTHLTIEGIQATDIYGGGNAAGVSGSTSLDIDDSVVDGNIYGGGNEGVVEGSTIVTVTDSHIKGNAFAGGNGSTAIVYQNSTITIDGSSEIGTSTSEAPDGGCVFGSGNAASTGLESVHTSQAVVNIVGGEIHGNVYGGPKMAVVYGTTDTNIGTAAVNQAGLVEDDIIIHGTVFGGGESNASGSETYDWTFISVTEGIEVLIDGTNYEAHNHQFVINGSIFGSGNASSSSGGSTIYIKNLGTIANPNISVSIQRADLLTIESSVIELLGTTDRTNEYSDVLYSFNIIDKMIIKNNTTLLLQHNANLLKELYSGVDSGGNLVPATVTINDENQTVTKNVDNRIYMIPGQNLNVTINQAATAYGEITGMTFFGMYNSYGNGSYRYGLYDSTVSYGDSGNASMEIAGGSYVVGLRKTNHDITRDGFYTNSLDEDNLTSIVTAYIDPTRIGDTGYRWVVGFEAINYEFTLTASKYSSLGTYELQMIHFAEGNTTFTILGFDSTGLQSGISLIDSNLVPRVGSTQTEANTVYGLSLKAETQEWTGYGTTKLLSADGGDFTGTDEYLTDNRSLPPSLMFYLYHAKNITAEGPLGTVVVTLQAAIPRGNHVDDDIRFITITIHLTAINADSDSYDAAITYDKKYEMPSATSVNITNTSQFSAYYSLTTFKDDVTKVYGNNNENFHVLVTDRPLPVDTMITMLDYGANDDRPEYYYFRITQSVYNDSVTQLATYHEITYRLSNFIKMDSTSTTNTYHDAPNNLLYYDSTTHLVDEEFMFIFDFKECTAVTGDHLDNSMLFELRNAEDRTVFSVLGIREDLMYYSTYESSNAVLSQTFQDVDSYLYYNIPDEFTYKTEIQYDETENRQSVIDTNYESRGMGLNVAFFDRDGEAVSSSLLLGTSITIGNQQYFADGDGIFRIKLSNKVSNLFKNASITPNTDLPAGQYTIRYTLFASDDGLHNSDAENSVYQEFNVTVVSADNSITVDCEDLVKVVSGETGLNLKNNRINTYHVKYSSELTNPNFRVEVYKRGVTTSDSTDYQSIPFNQLFTNSLTTVSGNEVSISMDNLSEKDFNFELQSTLTSGTYRVVFKLYDSNQLIDDEIKYVIVNKNVQ